MRSPFKKYPLDLMNNCMTFVFFCNRRGRNFPMINSYIHDRSKNERDFCCYHKYFDGRVLD